MINDYQINNVKRNYTHARVTPITRTMIDALAETRGGNESAVIRDAVALLFKQELENKKENTNVQLDQA